MELICRIAEQGALTTRRYTDSQRPAAGQHNIPFELASESVQLGVKKKNFLFAFCFGIRHTPLIWGRTKKEQDINLHHDSSSTRRAPACSLLHTPCNSELR